MKKILIVTDAWLPQINGVVTTMTKVVEHLKAKGFDIEVLHPGHFHTFPLPNYPEISVAWNFWDLRKKIEKIDPDFIHISVCLLYTSPSPRDRQKSRMPSSA